MNLPKIGFGTWQLAEGAEAEAAVTAALEAGYKLVDTASIYGNETSVGRAIAAASQPRSEIIVTTKLWLSDMGYESALAAFEASLSRLGLDYVDLYLIHWPGNDAKLRQQSWQALEEIKNSGRARAIGVSNYQVSHLEELLSHAATKPAANQIELHPFIYEQQKPILDFCREQGIAVEAYSPLAQAGNLNEPALEEIARQYSKSPAQVMLRWAIAHRTTPLPRSRNPERIRENIDIFDFDLTPADMQRLNGLSNGRSALH